MRRERSWHIATMGRKPMSRFRLRLYMLRNCGKDLRGRGWDSEIDEAIELIRKVLKDTSRFNLLEWYNDHYPLPTLKGDTEMNDFPKPPPSPLAAVAGDVHSLLHEVTSLLNRIDTIEGDVRGLLREVALYGDRIRALESASSEQHTSWASLASQFSLIEHRSDDAFRDRGEISARIRYLEQASLLSSRPPKPENRYEK